MKQYVIYKNDTGEIISSPSCSIDQTMEIPPQLTNVSLLEVDIIDSDLDLKGYVDIVTQTFVWFNEEQLEGKRTAHLFNSTWVYETKQWIPSVSAQLEYLKKDLLSKGLEKLHVDLKNPCDVLGDVINADSLAITNINNKIQELTIMDIPNGSPLLFWRLFDNTNKVFESKDDMLSWLRQALACISLCRSSSYENWWKKKNIIDSAETIEELEILEI